MHMRRPRWQALRKPRHENLSNTCGPGWFYMQAWASITARQWIRARHGPRRRTSTLWCQRVLAVAGVAMRSQRAGCATRNVASAARFFFLGRENLCGQREKGDGKGKAKKGYGTGKHQNTDTWYTCGKSGHRNPDRRHRNENCSTCRKRDTRVRCADQVRAQAPMRTVEVDSDAEEDPI